ncbi:MAG: Mu transposase domain-containing protein [Candidatus Eiseniibacteriota bacterium]
MSYREVTMLEIREVLRLWYGGAAKKRIAAQLGLDIKTVRRYLRAAQVCGIRPGGEAPSEEQAAAVVAALQPDWGRRRGDAWAVCAGQRAFVASHLEHGVRLSKIRRLLRGRGVPVSYAALRRYAIAELGFGRVATTIPVADGAPGDELQIDTGWMGYLEPDLWGRRRRLRAWIFTPGVSRYRFVYPCFQETIPCAIEACEAAWEFYGGVFRTLIPDNTKAIVQEPDALAPRITRAFLEYAQARGFQIDPARARHPRDKARTERAVRDVRDDGFAGEHLQNLEMARPHARHWCEHEYGMRRHSTTQRRPREHFEAEERAHLLPAPTARYDLPLWCQPKVARDQHAQVARGLYSLPRPFVGRRLVARADSATVRFFQGLLLVKTHPRVPPGQRSTDPSDFPAEKSAYARRDVAFLEGQAARHGAAIGRYAHALLDVPLPWTRMRRVYALLGLVKRHGAPRVEAVCVTALEVGMLEIHRLKRMLELAAPAALPAAAARVIPLARYLRPAQQYALRFTPDPHPEGEPRR